MNVVRVERALYCLSPEVRCPAGRYLAELISCVAKRVFCYIVHHEWYNDAKAREIFLTAVGSIGEPRLQRTIERLFRELHKRGEARDLSVKNFSDFRKALRPLFAQEEMQDLWNPEKRREICERVRRKISDPVSAELLEQEYLFHPDPEIAQRRDPYRVLQACIRKAQEKLGVHEIDDAVLREAVYFLIEQSILLEGHSCHPELFINPYFSVTEPKRIDETGLYEEDFFTSMNAPCHLLQAKELIDRGYQYSDNELKHLIDPIVGAIKKRHLENIRHQKLTFQEEFREALRHALMQVAARGLVNAEDWTQHISTIAGLAFLYILGGADIEGEGRLRLIEGALIQGRKIQEVCSWEYELYSLKIRFDYLSDFEGFEWVERIFFAHITSSEVQGLDSLPYKKEIQDFQRALCSFAWRQNALVMLVSSPELARGVDFTPGKILVRPEAPKVSYVTKPVLWEYLARISKAHLKEIFGDEYQRLPIHQRGTILRPPIPPGRKLKPGENVLLTRQFHINPNPSTDNDSCMYVAIAQEIFGIEQTAIHHGEFNSVLRFAAYFYIKTHQDEYAEFLSKDVRRPLHEVCLAHWGSEATMDAICKVFGVGIDIWDDRRPIYVEHGDMKPNICLHPEVLPRISLRFLYGHFQVLRVIEN